MRFNIFRAARCTLGLAVLCNSGVMLWAQAPATTPLSESGRIEAVGPGMLKMKTDNAVWVVSIGRGQSKVQVEGTAEPDYLRAGLPVKFVGEIADAKGALKGEIAELEIFSPQGKTAIGLFNKGGDAGAKPVKTFGPGEYEIRGKVASFKDGELVVSVGPKKVSGKVASGLVIKVNVDDIAYAQAGDAVDVKGVYYEHGKPDPNLQKPGEAIGQEVSVKLAKPLASRKKTAKTTKPPREPKEPKTKPTAEGAEETKDPFGLDKPVKKPK